MTEIEALRNLARKYRDLAEVGDAAERSWRLKLAESLEWRAYQLERIEADRRALSVGG
jgi:hypothetical protein